jgi:uncharacterized protein YdeI (YjbR/CyaY-like superfamily)
MDEREILYIDSVAEWAEWLDAHHADTDGVRLAIVKKSAGGTASYGEYLDIALCYGWIDGRRNSLDDQRFLQLFTPRTKSSIWSERNREHVARLSAAGAMRPAGLAEVERAKADGRWESAYAPQSTAGVPGDLAEALAGNAEATAFFETLSAQNRFAILFRIANVKRAETRARKITEYVDMLARHETIYPQPDRSPTA